MKRAIFDDPTSVLASQRAALSALDARERETRLAAARQREEARFVEADRVAATFGRFLRRTTARPQSVPVPLRRQHGEHEQAAARQQDAA